MLAQARHDTAQIVDDIGRRERQYPIGDPLRAGAIRGGELGVVLGGNERSDNDARRVGLEEDRRVLDDVLNHLAAIGRYRAPRTWC